MILRLDCGLAVSENLYLDPLPAFLEVFADIFFATQLNLKIFALKIFRLAIR